MLEKTLNRRDFLIKLGLFAATTALSGSPAFGAIGQLLGPEKKLSFYNTHTGEKLDTVFWTNGRYRPEALSAINRILRDHRTGNIKPIDPHLLDLLYALNTKLGSKKPFHIISGYRSPETNNALRKHSKGVASRSLHLRGKAVDIRLPGIDLKRLRKAALELRAGGVGYYSRSDFVHLDTGRFRQWGS